MNYEVWVFWVFEKKILELEYKNLETLFIDKN
jgi:hypothetical protein